MNLEDRLRAELRPVDPGDAFADRVLARLDASAVPAARAGSRIAPRWAIAATVLLTIGAGVLVHQQRERQRVAVAHQLTLALAVTSSQLDHLHRHLDFKIRELP